MRKKILLCAAILVLLASTVLLFYPLISSSYNARHQSDIRVEFQAAVERMDKSSLEEARAAAERYNAALVPGVRDGGDREEAFSNQALEAASEGYGDLLNLTGSGVMGYVVIPKIHVDLPICHGTADLTLENGVGHLLGTSLPVGGESTHCVLTGHSGMSSSRMFSDLGDLAVGDVFYLDVLGTRQAYQVDQILTVLPEDTSSLTIFPGEDLCTLVTCTPFGVNTHRLLVRGSRIEYEEAEAIVQERIQDEPHASSTWEREYVKGILLGLAFAVVMIAVLVGTVFWRRRK